MAIVADDILRVAVSILFPDDVIMQNVFHMLVKTIVDGDESTVTQDMDDYLEFMWTALDNNMGTGMVGDEIKVYRRDVAGDDWDEIGTSALSITPSGGAGITPHGVSLVQNFVTENPDVQGRKFWGGFVNSSLTNQAWAGSILTNAAAAAVSMVSEYTDASSSNVYTPGVWSPTDKLIYDYQGTVFTSTIPGYQRRRKPGVGI